MPKIWHRVSANSEPVVGSRIRADCTGPEFEVVGVPNRMPALASRCPLCHVIRDEPPGIGMTVFYVEEEVAHLPGEPETDKPVTLSGHFHVETRRVSHAELQALLAEREIARRAEEVRTQRTLRLLPPKPSRPPSKKKRG